MTDPSIAQQLSGLVAAPGTVEIIVRVAPPADNWLLDLVTPAERDTIRLKYFTEQLERLRVHLDFTESIRYKLMVDRGEASVWGSAKAVYELVCPGGWLERDSQLQVLPRVRFGKHSFQPRRS